MPVETTANKIRIRVRDPGLFQEGTFRTKRLAGVKGVQIVIGKLKNSKKDSMVVQTYLFDKKSWTKEEALKWMKSHVRKHQVWEDMNFISDMDSVITSFEDEMLKIEEVTKDNVEFLFDGELIILRNRFKQIYIDGFNEKADSVMTEVRKRHIPCWNTWLEKEMRKKRELFEKVEQPPYPPKELKDYEDDWYIQVIVSSQSDADVGWLNWLPVSGLKGVYFLFSEKLQRFVGMLFYKEYGWTMENAKNVLTELLGSKYYSNLDLSGIKSGEETQTVRKEKVYDEAEGIELSCLIFKIDEEERIVSGVVYSPEEVDAHGEYMTAKTIRKMAHDWLMKFQVYKDMHNSELDSVEIRPLESFISPVDFAAGTQIVKSGDWILTSKVISDDLWNKIKKGERTGYSIGGSAKRRKI